MRPKRVPLAAACALALVAPPAFACSVCGRGDPLLTSSDPEGVRSTGGDALLYCFAVK